MFIGIISYLPDDITIRQKRLQAHKKQIDNLQKFNLPIYVVAQNYKQNEYIKGVNYIYMGAKLGPSGARNLLLKQFYATNQDFMWMLDDDIYPYNYYDLDLFINEINTNVDKFKELDYIRPVFAFQVPFKKQIYSDYRNARFYVFTDKNSINTTCCGILRNLNKYYNKCVFYDDLDMIHGGGYEDKDFCFKLKQNNIKTHVLDTFICGSYNYTDNSTLFDSFEQRSKVHDSNNSYIFDKYKDMVDSKNILLPVYRNHEVLVKRLKPLVLDSNLIPKDVTNNTLF